MTTDSLHNTPTEHTPGPWRVGFPDGSGADDGAYWITPIDEDAQAVVYGATHTFDGAQCGVRTIADARLIAAAPDMLAALEAALPLLRLAQYAADKAHDFEFRDRLLAIEDAHRAAIALARGEAVAS